MRDVNAALVFKSAYDVDIDFRNRFIFVYILFFIFNIVNIDAFAVAI